MSERTKAMRVRAGTGVLVVAALSLGRLITDKLPTTDDTRGSRPFMVAGSIGQDIQLRSGTVKITKVRGSTKMVSTQTASISPAVWVVVDYVWTPRDESTVLAGASITSGEDEWSLVSRRNVNYCKVSLPGVPVNCTVTIEAPAAALPGAHFHLYLDRDFPTYDSMADVPLNISAETAKNWATSTEIIEVPDASFETS